MEEKCECGKPNYYCKKCRYVFCKSCKQRCWCKMSPHEFHYRFWTFMDYEDGPGEEIKSKWIIDYQEKKNNEEG